MNDFNPLVMLWRAFLALVAVAIVAMAFFTTGIIGFLVAIAAAWFVMQLGGFKK